MRAVASLLALVGALATLLAAAGEARAHAALVRAEPADGAVMAAPPAALVLTFNEPVAPLVMRLFGPDGEPIALGPVEGENTTVTATLPPGLSRGSHVLSWRVISADGHPVGGSLIFSVGAPSAPSAQRPAGAPADAAVRVALWMARVALYLGLFLGVGGAFFRAWLARGRALAVPWIVALLAGGLIAAPLSVGLQGLDALELPLAGLTQQVAWQTGLETSYGRTAIMAALALLAALLAIMARSPTLARGLALVGLIGLGLALSASGHAGTAPPIWFWLAWPSNAGIVFVHVVCVAFWIGALLPLLAAVHAASGEGDELRRFSRAIVVVVAVLIASGLWLAVVQLDHVEALWSTGYGLVLCGKLVAVMGLLALAAANRYRLVPRYQQGGAATGRPFARALAGELALALAIFGVVALWRFTPPPRALAAPASIALHIHGEKAMAEIALERQSGQGARADLMVLDGEFRPLAAKAVTLVLANPAAGIEPMRRAAAPAGENRWRIDNLRIPIPGRWRLGVEILVSDFDKVTIEDTVALPRAP